MVDDPGDIEIKATEPLTVLETRTLYRLTPVMRDDLSQASRQTAIVPADSEEEARRIAAIHDIRGNDWRDAGFASCDVIETSELHVVGDVVFESTPGPTPARRRARR